MILHLFLYQFNGLSRYVATLIIKKAIFSKQRKKSISYTASELRIKIVFILQCMLLPEIGDLSNLSFQVISVLEEVTFMIGIEIIPNFCCFRLGFIVFTLRQKMRIFSNILLGLLNHLRRKFV